LLSLDVEQEDNSTGYQLANLGALLSTDEVIRPLTIRREKALWDIPVIFVILIFITGLEWYLRRRENLV